MIFPVLTKSQLNDLCGGGIGGRTKATWAITDMWKNIAM